jgi:hypothetical protein
MHLHTPLIARRLYLISYTPRGGVKPLNALWRGWITVVNGLALTCKFHVWHCWEGPETTTGAYGNWCKPAHTVHVVNNFNFNFNYSSHYNGIRGAKLTLDAALFPVCSLCSCCPLEAERYLTLLSMSLTRTVWRQLMPPLGCLLMPRLSSPTPWAVIRKRLRISSRGARGGVYHNIACTCYTRFHRCVGVPRLPP